MDVARAKNYDFFCCAPTDYNYKDCVVRLEDRQRVTFAEARDAKIERYLELAPDLKSKSSGETTEEEIDPTKNLVISEFHADLHPKKELAELLPKLGPDAVLVLERLPSSQNAAVQKWLTDDNKNSPLPPALEAYCTLVDQSNLKQSPPTASDEYRKKISSATKDILFAAKQSGVGVMYYDPQKLDTISPNLEFSF